MSVSGCSQVPAAIQMKSYRQLSTVNAGTRMHQNQWLVKANGNGARLMALSGRASGGESGRGKRDRREAHATWPCSTWQHAVDKSQPGGKQTSCPSWASWSRLGRAGNMQVEQLLH